MAFERNNILVEIGHHGRLILSPTMIYTVLNVGIAYGGLILNLLELTYLERGISERKSFLFGLQIRFH